MLGKEPECPRAIEARRHRARTLRDSALALADLDAAAYRHVLAVQRRRDAPGHQQRLRQALADAADPLVRIVETAREVSELAVAAVADARGGVRGRRSLRSCSPRAWPAEASRWSSSISRAPRGSATDARPRRRRGRRRRAGSHPRPARTGRELDPTAEVAAARRSSDRRLGQYAAAAAARGLRGGVRW